MTQTIDINSLAATKEGDSVFIETGMHDRKQYQPATVKRTTTTQITAASVTGYKRKFRREDGRLIGGTWLDSDTLRPGNEHYAAKFAEQERAKAEAASAAAGRDEASELLKSRYGVKMEVVGEYAFVWARGAGEDVYIYLFKRNAAGIYKRCIRDSVFATIEDAFAAIAGHDADDEDKVARCKLLLKGSW